MQPFVRIRMYSTGYFFNLVFLFVLALSFMGYPAGAYAEEKEISIGFIGPLSGDVAAFGMEARNAVELATEGINSSHYIPGIRLNIIYEDAKCSGKDASIAANKLINVDHVKVIIGGACSGETLAAAKITEAAKFILFTSFSSNPAVSDAGDFVFRNCVSDRDGGRELANMMLRKGYLRPAVISENTDFCLGLRDTFSETLARGKVPLAGDEVFNPADTDFRSILLRIKSKSPDAILVNPQAGLKAGLITRQIRELNWDIPILGNNNFSSADAREAAGGIARLEGIQFADAPSISSERGKAFIQKYKDRYGDKIQSDYLIAFSGDSVYLIADAIKAAGLNSEGIRDYFYGLKNFSGIGYNYHFDINGDMVGVNYTIKQIRSGKIEDVSQ